jgi:hypothetical protein
MLTSRRLLVEAAAGVELRVDAGDAVLGELHAVGAAGHPEAAAVARRWPLRRRALPVKAVVMVELSTAPPSMPTRAMTRLTVAEADDATLAVPGLAS